MNYTFHSSSSFSSSFVHISKRKMGKASEEDGVLKLVRAGGIVERYMHPIKAAHIMERYPRHCVTRPDFFKFPNIVVKPESILKPGQVFYLVPYHTIYRLIQSKGCRHRKCTRDPSESITKQNLENMQQMEEIDASFFHRTPLESIGNKKQSNRQVANISMEARRDGILFSDGVYDSPEALASGRFLARRKGGGLAETIKDTNGCLKPCLKKNRSKKPRAQQGPRVRFLLPDEHDEKWNADDFPEF